MHDLHRFLQVTKTSRVRLVENTVERTARMLAREYGIRVVWKGTRAFTDGKTIVLPSLPDDAPDELLEAVQGYVDHETAHVIFTDFSVPVEELSEEQHRCVNAVEDIRIESRMGELFPGTPYNFRKCYEWVVSRARVNWADLNQFRRAILAYLCFAKYGEQDELCEMIDESTRVLARACVEAAGPDIESTEDAQAAGLRIWDILKDYAAQEEQERKEREAAGGSILCDAQGRPIVTSISELSEGISAEAKILIDQLGDAPAISSGYEHGKETSGYLIWSTADDTVELMDVQGRRDQLATLRDRARETTSVIKSRLVNSLRAMSKRRWVGNKSEGKLDSRKLHRTLIGSSDTVYKQLSEKLDLDVVVGLAIDHSGSMDGYRLELASQAAIVLGDALNALRIPFMVYGYSTLPNLKAVENQQIYARWCSLWIRYYRDFGEAWDTGATRLTAASGEALNNTLDAESVQHGVRRLLARPERRKILLVLSDGMPNPGQGHVGKCQQRLHDVVAAATQAGVEVIGLGISSHHVSSYFPNHVVISQLKDLVAKPLVLLDKMLRGGIHYK